MNGTYQYRTDVTVAPAVEPVALVDAKIHLRVDNADDDGYIMTLIQASREWAEDFTRRKFINTTVRLSLDAFPEQIRLPFGKTQSVSSVDYYDEVGDTVILSPSVDYVVDSASEPARVVLAEDAAWPAVQDIPNAIRVTYVVGYGATAVSVPAKVKQAILLVVGHLYENRENSISGTSISKLPLAAENLLMGEVIKEFF